MAGLVSLGRVPLVRSASVRHRAAAWVEPPSSIHLPRALLACYALVRLVLEFLIVHGRGEVGSAHEALALRAEALTLRHQVRALERLAGRPRWPATLSPVVPDQLLYLPVAKPHEWWRSPSQGGLSGKVLGHGARSAEDRVDRVPDG